MLWQLGVLVCACDAAPASDADPTPPSPSPAAPSASASAPDVAPAATAAPVPKPAPGRNAEPADANAKPTHAAKAEVDDAPAATVDGLAKRGIVLPAARGGAPVNDAGLLVEVSAERVVIPNGARVQGQRWLAVDTTTPFETMVETLVGGSVEGGSEQLLVTHEDDVRAFELHVQPAVAVKATPRGLGLLVAVLEDGYRVDFAGQQRPAPVTVSMRPSIPLHKPGAPMAELDRWDTAALAKKIVEFKTLFPHETSAVLCAEPTVPVGAVVATAEVLRGSTCSPGLPQACSFPDLSVCRQPWGVKAAADDGAKPAAETPVPAGAPATRTVKVRQGKTVVDAGMDPGIARRIVRSHLGEVRACYEKGTPDDAAVSGGVTVEFQINTTGKVSKATVTKTSLSNETVETCIEKAGKRWKFPRPTGHTDVVVTMPFTFEPG
ncbi:MAG: AgmX/PglI C-terminal domain-containing protein [Myxococcota bacterium]